VKIRVQRWGNSLAVRIPKAFAKQVGLEDGSPVELAVVGDHLVVEPAQPSLQLDDLLAGVTEENIHQEIDTGASVGNEAW
jgi:antitoxin MazE